MPEIVDLLFPAFGVNVVGEIHAQPRGTTPTGINVRFLEALAERFRGGSRPGMSKLIGEQVNGNNPVQHLAILVSTNEGAINTDYPSDDSRSWSQTNPDDDTITDPSTNNNSAGLGDRNPNRTIRQGGSGRQSVRGSPSSFCRTYRVASGFEESYNDFTICTSYEFPYDFTAVAGGFGGTYIAPGPSPPSLDELNEIIRTAESDTFTAYDDFEDNPE